MVSIVPSLIQVLIIAHPDDESMFFLPWIYYTTMHRQRNNDPSIPSAVWLLCLTTGNFDGLGEIRSKEVHDFNKYVLNDHSFQKVLIIDEPDIMPDHPNQRWNISLTAEQIYTKLHSTLNEEYGSNSQRPSTLSIVTFDQRGVSGHVNHIDTYLAVQHLYQQQLSLLQSSSTSSSSNQQQVRLASKALEVWVLQTIQNPIIKYIPIVEWVRFLLHTTLNWYPKSDMHIDPTTCPTPSSWYRLLQPSLNWYAMSTHQSQFVWYRRLFVIFSIYTYRNTFHKLLPHHGSDGRNEEYVTISYTNMITRFPILEQQRQGDDDRAKKEL